MKLLNELRVLKHVWAMVPSKVIEKLQKADNELFLANDEVRKARETCNLTANRLSHFTTMFRSYSGVQLTDFVTELHWLRLENSRLKSELSKIARNNAEADFIIPRGE